MIAGWLTASTQSVAGCANGIEGNDDTALAVRCRTPGGSGTADTPSPASTSAPVITPSPAVLYVPGGPAPTTHLRTASPTSSSWMNCPGASGAGTGIGTGSCRIA